jgi:hypothetical protein
MKPPMVVEETSPKSHKMIITTAIVHSIAVLLSSFGLVFNGHCGVFFELPAQTTGRSVMMMMFDQTDQVQQNERADNRRNQQTKKACARDVELTEQPDSDKGTYHPNDQISHQTEPAALPDVSGQESCQDPNPEKYQQMFRTHGVFSFIDV